MAWDYSRMHNWNQHKYLENKQEFRREKLEGTITNSEEITQGWQSLIP